MREAFLNDQQPRPDRTLDTVATVQSTGWCALAPIKHWKSRTLFIGVRGAAWFLNTSVHPQVKASLSLEAGAGLRSIQVVVARFFFQIY